MMISRIIPYLIFWLCLNLSSVVIADATDTPSCAFRDHQSIEISGKHIANALNENTDQLQIVSYRNGQLQSIPYQFEDHERNGDISFAKFTQIPARLNRLDPYDKLLIKTKDLGETLPATNNTPYLSKISINTKEAHGIIYVIRSNPLNNTIKLPLIQYNKRTGILETPCFKLKTQPKNFLIWNGFFYKPLGVEARNNLLDTFKLRLSADLIGPLPRMDADNQDILPTLLAIEEGPLRTHLLMNATISVLKIPVANIEMLWNIENLTIRNQATVTIPNLLANMIQQPLVTMSLDGKNLNGSTVLSSANPNRPLLVDGKMDAQEKTINGQSLNPQNNWILLHLPAPLDISSQIVVPKEFNSPLLLLYQDNQSLIDKPEQYPGQGPNIGYQLSNFSLTGKFVFRFDLFLSNGVEKPPIF